METPQEMLSRVKMMASGSDTWDLSDNDLEALQFILTELEDARAQLRAYSGMDK